MAAIASKSGLRVAHAPRVRAGLGGGGGWSGGRALARPVRAPALTRGCPRVDASAAHSRGGRTAARRRVFLRASPARPGPPLLPQPPPANDAGHMSRVAWGDASARQRPRALRGPCPPPHPTPRPRPPAPPAPPASSPGPASSGRPRTSCVATRGGGRRLNGVAAAARRRALRNRRPNPPPPPPPAADHDRVHDRVPGRVPVRPRALVDQDGDRRPETGPSGARPQDGRPRRLFRGRRPGRGRARARHRGEGAGGGVVAERGGWPPRPPRAARPRPPRPPVSRSASSWACARPARSEEGAGWQPRAAAAASAAVVASGGAP